MEWVYWKLKPWIVIVRFNNESLNQKRFLLGQLEMKTYTGGQSHILIMMINVQKSFWTIPPDFPFFADMKCRYEVEKKKNMDRWIYQNTMSLYHCPELWFHLEGIRYGEYSIGNSSYVALRAYLSSAKFMRRWIKYLHSFERILLRWWDLTRTVSRSANPYDIWTQID